MQQVASAAVTLRRSGYEDLASEMNQAVIQELLAETNSPPEPKPQRRSRKRSFNRIDEAFLKKVADAHRGAEPRGKTAAVVKAVGCAPKSVGYYVGRAREAGLLD